MTETVELHPTHVLRVHTLTERSGARVILEGEADLANVDRLDGALATINLQGATSVELVVSDLDFCDVVSMRRLFVFARDVRQSGSDVVTSGARPVFARVARIFGADTVLGIS
jgi:anti-anti-sigma regulatory factor